MNNQKENLANMVARKGKNVNSTNKVKVQVGTNQENDQNDIKNVSKLVSKLHMPLQLK